MEKEQLTSNQLKVINYFLQNDSIEAASKKAKVARGTIYAWMKLEAFKNRLEDGRNEIYTEGLNALKVATRKASMTLIELLDNSDRNTRRLAAKEIIRFAAYSDDSGHPFRTKAATYRSEATLGSHCVP